jgi:hypothetical protein
MPAPTKPRASDYLFTWKMGGDWPHDELRKLVDAFEIHGFAQEDWSCAAYTKIRVGDRAYLLRQGKPSRGIFGRGRIASEPHRREPALPHKSKWQVEIRFDGPDDMLCDPEERFLIPWEQLLRVAPKEKWQLEPSGIGLEGKVARELDGMISALQEDPDEAVIDAAEQIRSARTSQGFLVSPAVKKAVEEHAVQIAKSHYEKKGYAVKVKGKPYDLHCTHAKDNQVFVEVKGTQTSGDEVLLTRNEVKFARQNKTDMALFVVHGITVDKLVDPPSASGGTTRLREPWDIDSGELEPMAYSYKLPKL